MSAESRELLQRNEQLRNRFRAQRCFVLGNGSSLGKQDISRLAGEIVIAANSFYKHPLIGDLKPACYCIADPVYFDGSSTMSEYFTRVRAAVPETSFLVPIRARPVIERLGLLPPEQTFYVATHGQVEEQRARGQLDPRGYIMDPQSVSVLQLQAALIFGCNPIYLLGLDHDWLLYRNPEGPPWTNVAHFYTGNDFAQHTSVKEALRNVTFRDDLSSHANLWDEYGFLHEVAQKKETEIINLTAGGFLDVFPRQDFASVVGQT